MVSLLTDYVPKLSDVAEQLVLGHPLVTAHPRAGPTAALVLTARYPVG